MRQASSRFSGRASLSSRGETRVRPGTRPLRRIPHPAAKPPRGDPPGKAPPGQFVRAAPDKRPPGSGPPTWSDLVEWTGAHQPIPWASAAKPVACGPEPPGRLALGGAPPGQVNARGDPPGSISERILGKASPHPPGKGPPGPMRTRRRGPPGTVRRPNSSLSAGRRRGLLLVTRPETARHEAVRTSKPKSRKIIPWL